jgi:UDP-N-acetylglucosamine 2-epimerase (non-hydrolysing)
VATRELRMRAPAKILNVVSTRTMLVKIAPLIAELERQPGIRPILVHTGPHYREAMSDHFFAELDLRQPDFDLGVESGSCATQIAQIIKRIEPVLDEVRPDLVMVFGDLDATLATALTAVKLGVPVAHVEAGLRSFQRTMPDELNRILIDAISTELFVTHQSGMENLCPEGRSDERVHFVGNVMVDALLAFRSVWERRARIIRPRLGLAPAQHYAVLTLHRPLHVNGPLKLADLLDGIEVLGAHMPVVFPVHPRLWPELAGHDLVRAEEDSARDSRDKRLICIDPLDYLDFIALLSTARVVLTDSGGVQDETTVLGVPCLTLREATERPMSVTHGTNRVIGTDPGRIAPEVLRTVDEPPAPTAPPPLWDGRAACRIVEILLGRQIASGDPARLRGEDATWRQVS